MEHHLERHEEEAFIGEEPVQTAGVAKDYMESSPAFAEELLPVHLNQPLIEATRRLKAERDMVRVRFDKMEGHRDQVSEAVYAKVKADYLAKYRELAEVYAQKKQAIDVELEKLYEATRELSLVLEKHRSELEEAKFRHFLGEFPDQRYKAIEKREEKEICKQERVLAKLQEYIDAYEALLVPDDDVLLKASALREGKPSKASVSASKKAAAKAEHKGHIGINLLEREAGAVAAEPSFSKREPLFAPRDDAFHKTESHLGAFDIEEDRKIVPTRKERGTPFIQEEESIADILRHIPLEAQGSVETSQVEVTPATAMAKLTVVETGGEPIQFTELTIDREAYIGRLPANTVVLPSAKVSRRHAQIALREGEYVIVDLESANGVFINGGRVKESLLRDGDTIGIGRYRLRFALLP